MTTTVLICRVLAFGLNWWNGLYFMERVVGNYYVSADKVQRLAASSADGAKDADKLSDRKLRHGKLQDKVDEHPLPSVPGFSRKITFDAKDQVTAWGRLKARAGS